jgi:HNH endonuclease
VAGRAEVIERVAELAGEEVLRITSAGSGWPALGELVADGVAVPVALFGGQVGLSFRGRDEIERRFQNPGADRPILEVPGRHPLLLGLWETDELEPVPRPLLVSADPVIRTGRRTRFSVFVGVATLRRALEVGWAQGQSARGESVRAFAPPLLPISYIADRDRAVPPMSAMRAVIEGSGLLSASGQELRGAASRARRAGSTLVRDARFSRRVIEAYGGLCAMCGLGVGLVEGAHIYPVSAPAAPDEPWNGLALCANHHLAFDRHLVGVDPESSEVLVHPDILSQAADSQAVGAFLSGTRPRLAEPSARAFRPRREMFELRYELFVDRYDWLLDP